jgi:hypothetical protein
MNVREDVGEIEPATTYQVLSVNALICERVLSFRRVFRAVIHRDYADICQ